VRQTSKKFDEYVKILIFNSIKGHSFEERADSGRNANNTKNTRKIRPQKNANIYVGVFAESFLYL
jgi:hypothetical protein